MSEKQAFVKDIPDNQQYQQLLDGQPQTHGMRSGRVCLKPGEECGLHSTKDHEELLTFLTGSGTAFIGEKELSVSTGQIAYIPPFTEHNIKNSSDTPFAYIYCVAPIRMENQQ